MMETTTAPPHMAAQSNMTVFTMEQAVEAVTRARDEVARTMEAKDAVVTHALAVERELAESQKRCVELQAQLVDHDSASVHELAKLREDRTFILEMLGITEVEWDSTRNHFDRAAHVAAAARKNRCRFVELLTRAESPR